MWSSSYTEEFVALDGDRVWEVWTDVEHWAHWQNDIEYAQIEGPFEAGAVIHMKPKGGPKVRIEVTEVEAPLRFVDITRFPLARMVDMHELTEIPDGIQIRSTITMEGPLAFLWRKLVGEGVAKSLAGQTAALADEARRA